MRHLTYNMAQKLGISSEIITNQASMARTGWEWKESGARWAREVVFQMETKLKSWCVYISSSNSLLLLLLKLKWAWLDQDLHLQYSLPSSKQFHSHGRPKPEERQGFEVTGEKEARVKEEYGTIEELRAGTEPLGRPIWGFHNPLGWVGKECEETSIGRSSRYLNFSILSVTPQGVQSRSACIQKDKWLTKVSWGLTLPSD